jgi:hypothetical protein
MAAFIDEVAAFFRVVDEQGGNRGDFQFANVPRSVGDNGEDEVILEITFLPSEISRRYDAGGPGWSLLAIAEYRAGKFDR